MPNHLQVSTAIVSLQELSIICVIGTEPHERTTEQTLELDVDLALSDMKCCQTDNLEDAIDYSEIARICHDIAKEKKFKLIEALGYAIAEKILKSSNAQWVRIRLRKPRPMPHLTASAVELILHRGS